MKVSIAVSSYFKRYTGGELQLEIEIAEGETAYNAACSAGIPRDEIGFIAVDGAEDTGVSNFVDESFVVSEGSVIRVYPSIIGG